MIIQDVSNRLKIIYTPDRKADFNNIAKELGFLEANFQPKKDVIINQFGTYSPYGGNASLQSIEIKDNRDNGGVTHVINDSFFFDYNNDNIDIIVRNLKHFGNKYIINIESKLFRGEFIKESESSIKNTKGNIIIFESDEAKKMTPVTHDFMHKMRMNNSRMIMPLIRKYADTVTLFHSKRHLLTGYANILTYLNFMKTPDRENLLSLTGKRGDCNVHIDKGNNRITLKVFGTNKGNIVMDFLINNQIYKSDKSRIRPSMPYILLNTKPIQLLNQKMIYFTAKYKKTTVFVIPLMLKSDSALKSLRGGFNLLS